VLPDDLMQNETIPHNKASSFKLAPDDDII